MEDIIELEYDENAHDVTYWNYKKDRLYYFQKDLAIWFDIKQKNGDTRFEDNKIKIKVNKKDIFYLLDVFDREYKYNYERGI